MLSAGGTRFPFFRLSGFVFEDVGRAGADFRVRLAEGVAAESRQPAGYADGRPGRLAARCQRPASAYRVIARTAAAAQSGAATCRHRGAATSQPGVGARYRQPVKHLGRELKPGLRLRQPVPADPVREQAAAQLEARPGHPDVTLFRIGGARLEVHADHLAQQAHRGLRVARLVRRQRDPGEHVDPGHLVGGRVGLRQRLVVPGRFRQHGDAPPTAAAVAGVRAEGGRGGGGGAGVVGRPRVELPADQQRGFRVLGRLVVAALDRRPSSPRRDGSHTGAAGC